MCGKLTQVTTLNASSLIGFLFNSKFVWLQFQRVMGSLTIPESMALRIASKASIFLRYSMVSSSLEKEIIGYRMQTVNRR